MYRIRRGNTRLNLILVLLLFLFKIHDTDISGSTMVTHLLWENDAEWLVSAWSSQNNSH